MDTMNLCQAWRATTTTAILAILLWAPRALALDCSDVMNMITVRVPENIVVMTIKDSGEEFSSADVECLIAGGAPASVVKQVQTMVPPPPRVAPPAETIRPSTQTLPPPAAPLPIPAQLKFDCLGGACIDAKTGPVSKAVVVVSGRKWTRTIEVCSGRIVHIDISGGWVQPGFTWSNLLAGTSTSLGYDEDGTKAYMERDRLLILLAGMGWFVIGTEVERGIQSTGLLNMSVNGLRHIYVEPSNSVPEGWSVAITSIHPNRRTLCQTKDEQGL